MATVPPGNKQVGEYTGIVTYGLQDGYHQAKLMQEHVVALANDPNTPQPLGPNPIFLGDYSGIVTYGLTDIDISRAYQLNAFVLVKEAEIERSKLWQEGAFALTQDPAEKANVLTPVDPISLYDYTGVITYGLEDLSITKLHQATAFVLLQEKVIRKELITFNVNLSTTQ